MLESPTPPPTGMTLRRYIVFASAIALAACGSAPDAPPAAPPGHPAPPAAAAATDWRDCRIPGMPVPAPGKLFVVDAGAPLEDAEPGRETIRRVDVLVPGPVALLLTAPDATAWLVRPSPETRIVGIFASGPASQRITGPGLGGARLERSTAFGHACGRYWMADGPGPAVAEATDAVFGRPHDAIYRMRIGSVIIGGTEPVPERLP